MGECMRVSDCVYDSIYHRFYTLQHSHNQCTSIMCFQSIFFLFLNCKICATVTATRLYFFYSRLWFICIVFVSISRCFCFDLTSCCLVHFILISLACIHDKYITFISFYTNLFSHHWMQMYAQIKQKIAAIIVILQLSHCHLLKCKNKFNCLICMAHILYRIIKCTKTILMLLLLLGPL